MGATQLLLFLSLCFCFVALCLSFHSYHSSFIIVIVFLSYVGHVTLLVVLGDLVLVGLALLQLFCFFFFVSSLLVSSFYLLLLIISLRLLLLILLLSFFQNALKLQENGLWGGSLQGPNKTRQEDGPRS